MIWWKAEREDELKEGGEASVKGGRSEGRKEGRREDKVQYVNIKRKQGWETERNMGKGESRR